MGTRVSKAAAAGSRPAAARPDKFSARCDGVTPELLDRIRASRDAGRLRSVTVDCRTCAYDDDAMARVQEAAGGHKVVMHA